jgi:hypothetical protein
VCVCVYALCGIRLCSAGQCCHFTAARLGALTALPSVLLSHALSYLDVTDYGASWACSRQLLATALLRTSHPSQAVRIPLTCPEPLVPLVLRMLARMVPRRLVWLTSCTAEVATAVGGMNRLESLEMTVPGNPALTVEQKIRFDAMHSLRELILTPNLHGSPNAYRFRKTAFPGPALESLELHLGVRMRDLSAIVAGCPNLTALHVRKPPPSDSPANAHTHTRARGSRAGA